MSEKNRGIILLFWGDERFSVGPESTDMSSFLMALVLAGKGKTLADITPPQKSPDERIASVHLCGLNDEELRLIKQRFNTGKHDDLIGHLILSAYRAGREDERRDRERP